VTTKAVRWEAPIDGVFSSCLPRFVLFPRRRVPAWTTGHELPSKVGLFPNAVNDAFVVGWMTDTIPLVVTVRVDHLMVSLPEQLVLFPTGLLFECSCAFDRLQMLSVEGGLVPVVMADC